MAVVEEDVMMKKNEAVLSQTRTDTRRPVDANRAGEAGIALVIALLALLLLTFLGLTMAATTTTELQIATNYRRARQAIYNAEAGIEVGRLVLRSSTWPTVLFAQRTAWSAALPKPEYSWLTSPRTLADDWGNTVRDFEYGSCDLMGNGMGYGQVLSSGGVLYQYQTEAFNVPLNGAFITRIP
jgi:type II secretory pathway pseudopilin PulG